MAAPVDAAETCDGLELEAMRKLDSSWLPCTVSLSSFGRGLCIDFRSQEPEDMILTKPEMLKRLRFRSIPLQGDDCSHIEQGKHVLAACKSQFPDCFYDAEVEKVLRVRHSKRINCRCTFTVKLLRKDVEGETFTVSSSSIMRLAEKSINDHPVVSEFLKSVERSQAIYPASPFFPVNQENGVEEDQDRLLEKPKGCNKFGDLKHGISRDILFGIGMKVEKKGQAQRRLIDEFDASGMPVQGSEEQIGLEASPQDPVKLQLDVEVEVPIPFGSSIFELSNNKSRLSPLAARAALASIVSASHSVITNGTKAGDSCIIGSVSPLGNKSLQMPSPILVAPESIDLRAIEACSTNETEVREPAKIARVTRSTTRGGSTAANSENQKESCDEEIQKSTLAKTRRFTRSSGLAERENVTTVDGLDYDLTQMTTSNRSSTERKVSKKNEKVSSAVHAEFHGPSKEKVEKFVDNKKKVEEKTSGAKQKDGEENSNVLKNVQQNEGSRESTLGQKRKSASSRKQERRFSPRLQFLPRTRSQGKSQL